MTGRLLAGFLLKTNLSRMIECSPNILINLTWKGLSTLYWCFSTLALRFPSHPQNMDVINILAFIGSHLIATIEVKGSKIIICIFCLSRRRPYNWWVDHKKRIWGASKVRKISGRAAFWGLQVDQTHGFVHFHSDQNTWRLQSTPLLFYEPWCNPKIWRFHWGWALLLFKPEESSNRDLLGRVHYWVPTKRWTWRVTR